MRQIAIIIPSLNSPLIGQVVTAVCQQTGIDQVTEILVVGQDAAGLLRQNDLVRLMDTGKPVSAGAARNWGIQMTQADLLIFLDSDCLPQPGWLAAHLAAHQAGHRVVGGGVLPQGENYWHLSYNLTLFHETVSLAPAGERPYFPTLNLSVDRVVIQDVGLLDASLERGQDVEWTTRMRRQGYLPYFCPEAAIYHAHNRTTLAAVWRDCARSGYYMRQVRLHHPEMLAAPGLLRYRGWVLGLSPWIAAWATWRIVRERPSMFRQYWRTLPAIYLTKMAWCWGASRREPPL